MAQTEELVVLANKAGRDANWQENVTLLLDVWPETTSLIVESLSHYTQITKATFYNWRSGKYQTSPDGFWAIKDWLGLDFTEPHSRDEIRTALANALTSPKGLYLDAVTIRAA